MRLTPSQPELNNLTAPFYQPNVAIAKLPASKRLSTESSEYVPNYSAQWAMLTLELQSTNERLQQLMNGMDKLTQKMTLINARLDGLR